MLETLAQRRERKARHAAVLWGSMTLGGISILSAFVIWHLFRRGRLLRKQLGPPRPSQLTADEDDDSPSSAT